MKILLIEKDALKARKIQESLLEFFEYQEITYIQDLKNAKLDKQENLMIVSSNKEIIDEINNKFENTELKYFVFNDDKEMQLYCVRISNNDILNNEHHIDCLIDEVFLTINLKRSLIGAIYIKTAIKLAINDQTMLFRNTTKKLYPKIAEMHSATPTKVERAIRHALETCFNSGRIMELNKLFKVNIFKEFDKPSNSEFIALIADKIKLNRHKNSFIKNYF